METLGHRDVLLQRALQHADVSRLARRLASRPALEVETAPPVRLAAVAAILRVVDEEPELLFIKRAEHAGDPWSGHMAFPGGRLEPGDASLEMTAVRETFEELALDLTHGQMIGRLDDLAPRSPVLPPIVIRPFVALVPPNVTFVPNAEVAATYWVPLSVLRHEGTRAEHEMMIDGVHARFPGFRVDAHIVWGLTERIVRQLLSLLDG
ncbi:MAG: NUDIX hydrolase [Gemmatimonas sp.]|jgi:8-oxo-dGTP pyrophosphatase MutT (NUDIX family)|uniref:NUDIX hydrolase n=1 Tax=Gemmatimonas sp. TaxID=1962908 RepID=UPI00391F7766|nr:CoA pyrophosphatase [Gemmatimonadota bacterium]